MMFSEMLAKSSEVAAITPKFDFEVNKLCYDSRKVERGDIFFAIKGLKINGNEYIKEAFSKGASAVFSDEIIASNGEALYSVNDCRKAMAVMSNIFYDFPSHKMKVIGVTGTNGKTTVTNIINHVLQFAGKKTGLIGTNGNLINKRFIQTEFTTPESVELNQLLNMMVDDGVEYATMEVSSHSLAMNRVYGIEFDVSVFTNLTPEHMDYHETMDNYFEAKKILFDSMKRINLKNNNTTVIYNADDEFSEKIVLNSAAERIAYGFGHSAYSVDNLKLNFGKTTFDMLVPLNGEGKNKIYITSKLTGKFNVYNILAAVAALKALKIPYEVIQNAIAQFEPVDGRFTQIKLNTGATAIVDYSHTPDSLYKAISTIREILDLNKSKGKIITVFGCGGNRDKNKRPLMGKIATDNSDNVIITSDNPRDEDPFEIINDIKSGIDNMNYLTVENREKAIEDAIKLSGKNDVVLIAGKGHETYQIIKGVKHHFSDREIAERFAE